MPNQLNNNSPSDTLDSKIVYVRIGDSRVVNSGVDGILELKVDFKNTVELSKFVGDGWSSSPDEHKWLANNIYNNDGNIDKSKPVTLKYIRYKDSIFDGNPVVVVVCKYTQE